MKTQKKLRLVNFRVEKDLPKKTAKFQAVLSSYFLGDGGQAAASRVVAAGLHAQAQHYQSAAAESAFSESEEILRRADEDGDGKLNAHEFERMETLYLQHEHAIGRRALFLFADGGEGPSGGGDGLVEASELQVLIFPESHPRGSALSRLMAAHVLKEHDIDGNGRVDKAELFAFHKKG